MLWNPPPPSPGSILLDAALILIIVLLWVLQILRVTYALIHHLVGSGLKTSRLLHHKLRRHSKHWHQAQRTLHSHGTGWHPLAPEGHKNLANRCIKCLQTMCTAPVKLQKMRSSFWHSFRSPSGSASANAQCQPVTWALVLGTGLVPGMTVTRVLTHTFAVPPYRAELD